MVDKVTSDRVAKLASRVLKQKTGPVSLRDAKVLAGSALSQDPRKGLNPTRQQMVAEALRKPTK